MLFVFVTYPVPYEPAVKVLPEGVLQVIVGFGLPNALQDAQAALSLFTRITWCAVCCIVGEFVPTTRSILV